MELSEKERRILVNQYEILKRIDPHEAESYEELIEILQNGYEAFYSMLTDSLCETMPSDEGSFVIDILTVYRVIEHYKRQNPQDNEIQDHCWGHFKGFDGNYETQSMMFTQFLIHRQNKFVEQLQYEEATDDFNSHTPVHDKYEQMINRWRGFDGPRRVELTQEEILSILEA